MVSLAPACGVEYYAGGANTWNTPAGQGDSDTMPETVTVCAAAMLQSTAAQEGEWVWCFYDEGPGAGLCLPKPRHAGHTPDTATMERQSQPQTR